MGDHHRSPIEVHSLEDENNEDIKVEDFLELLAALQSIPPVTQEDSSRREVTIVGSQTAMNQPQRQRGKKAESDALRNVQDAPRTVGQTNDKTVRRKKEQLLTVFSEFVNLTTLVNQANNQDGSFPRHEAVLVIMNQVKDPPTCGGRNTTDGLLRREKVELIAMGAGSNITSLKRIVHHLNRAEDSETKDQYDFQVLLHNSQSDIRKSTKGYIDNKSQKRRRGKREKSPDLPPNAMIKGSAGFCRSSFEEVDSAAISPSSLEEAPKDIQNLVLSPSSPRKRKSF
jgi:hypothetical protein